MSALTDCFTEAALTKLERCVEQALAAIGSSDPAAAEPLVADEEVEIELMRRKQAAERGEA